MQENKNALCDEELNDETIDLDDLESRLEADLEGQLDDLQLLEEDRKKMGDPASLGEVAAQVVWDQFVNEVARIAGEDFVKENGGLKLDLSRDAHIQTTENFAQGKIANHNTIIDYQERYDDWQANFQRDKDGNIIYHNTRMGTQEPTLVKGARDRFDVNRPTGSAERNTDIDHTVSAAEIIRDPEANAHLTKTEQEIFANSDANLNEMNSSLNRSKGEKSMTDWLDYPNNKGQTPREQWDMLDDELEQELRDKDKEAREEYARVKEEGEERSIEAGKKSRIAEAGRIGAKTTRAIITVMLADLVRKIIQKLIAWLRSSEKSIQTLLGQIKTAIHSFIDNLKNTFKSAVDVAVTTIVSSIWQPFAAVFKKAWIFLKQGWKSLKGAIKYLRDPSNKNKSFSIKMLEVSKILIAGITAGGAIILGEVIEKGLLTIPFFAIKIPLLGSLANILGIFFGAVIAGLIGALALNLIDKAIVKRQRRCNTVQQIEKMNQVLDTQAKLITVASAKTEDTKQEAINDINERHKEAASIMKDITTNIFSGTQQSQEDRTQNDDKLDDIFKTLDI